MTFSNPPEPLTPRQRAIVIAVAVLCAATRLLALARSLWDWDEALFTMAMRDYDVTLHHPHPPGFPVYIGMARLARLVISDDFRALQSVNLVAALLVFPAVYLLARELRLQFSTAVAAGALFAFFPNVWFFGGGAFSDIPSIVLVLFAITFLLRGTRSRGSYWIGTLLLALAIGIRPQNLLIGLFPGFLATRRRRWWEVLIALLIGVVVVGIAFSAAVYATGSLQEFLRMVREHGDYITRVDSFRSEARPPLWRIFDRFFVYQYQARVLSVIATLFVVISLVGSVRDRNRSMAWNAMTFVPFAIFAWLMLDRYSISRFSIGYQPMFALFVADGIRRVAKRHEWMLGSALVISFFVYTAPVLEAVRHDVSPPIVAVQTAVQHVDTRSEQLFVGQSMRVFMDLLAPDVPYTPVVDDRAMPVDMRERSWLLAEITTTKEEGFLFKRPRNRLWNIARRHYFEIKLAPLERRPQFVSGWHPAESAAGEQWRWMGGRSVTVLPPSEGESLLTMHVGVPPESAGRSTIRVKLNGLLLGELAGSGDSIARDFRIPSAVPGQPNTLELSIDRTVPPRDGVPERGLRLRSLTWGPA